jgi:hypothetical protein
MKKVEAVFLQPQAEGKWFMHDLSDGEVVLVDSPMSLELIKAIAPVVRVAFIENAYHTLASHSMFDLEGRDDVRFDVMNDMLPLVIMQDPPTICSYAFGTDVVIILDPANYGLSIDDVMPAQQLMAYRKLLNCHYWPSTAVAAAAQTLFRSVAFSDNLQTYQTLPGDSLIKSVPMGGNCGAGFYGQCPGNAYHHYDIQGAYLGAADAALPLKLLEAQDTDVLLTDMRDRCAKVTIETSYPSYPYRPSLEYTQGRKLTIYPTGTFTTVLCGDELQLATDSGHVKQVHRWERWACEPYLSRYVASMRQSIANAHPSIRSAVKTTALAGLGWFARKVKTWELADRIPPYPGYCGDYFRLETDGVRRYRCVAGQSMRESVGDYHIDAMPQTWAWIASSVRARLAGVLRHLGRHVMYWDTDSVITDSRGAAIMERRPDYGQPGGWVKKGTARTMHVWGYRRYSFGNQISIGLPIDARDEPGGRYVWESPETWDEAMGHRHYPDGRIVQRGKRLRGTYDHGRVCEDGRILPWEILPGDKLSQE